MSNGNGRTGGDEVDRPGFGDNYRRGLHSSAVGNAAAYGYSVTITATFGVLSATRGTPGVAQILALVVGAVVAVAMVPWSRRWPRAASGTGWRTSPAP